MTLINPQLLSAGTCTAGWAKSRLEIPEKFAMAGHSFGGEIGHDGGETFWVRAMYFRDAAGEECVLCVADILSGSRGLWCFVQEELKGATFDMRRVVLAGTHTHYAPGNYFRNSFYDLFAQNTLKAPKEHRGFQSKLTHSWAKSIAEAILQAKKDARASRLAIVQGDLWEVSRNRSDVAFKLNPEASKWNTDKKYPGHSAPPKIVARYKMIDPRLTAWVVFPEKDLTPNAVLAMFGMHATCRGRKDKHYSRDWPGITVDLVERSYAGTQTAIALAPEGDASPLPPDDDEGKSQSPALAETRGKQVADAVGEALEFAKSAPPSGSPLQIHVAWGDWKPGDESEKVWRVGWPVLAGAEDGRSGLPEDCAWEGMKANLLVLPPYQRPKRPVLHFLFGLVSKIGLLELSPAHPWNRVRFGTHILVTVPGEPTTMAGYRIERAVICADGTGKTATVVSNTGDYMGYFTTDDEYESQQYEGGHTLYGQNTVSRYAYHVTHEAGSTEPCPSGKPTYVFDENQGDAAWEQIVRELSERPRLIPGLRRGPELSAGVSIAWVADKAQYGERPRVQAQLRQRWFDAERVVRWMTIADDKVLWLAWFRPAMIIPAKHVGKLRVNDTTYEEVWDERDEDAKSFDAAAPAKP